MANNTVDLKFVADSTPIVQANKRLDTMGRTLEGLIKKQDAGAISDKQFAKAKKELRRSIDDLYPSWNRAKAVIDNLESSIKSNNATLAAEKEALRKAKEETKAFARARREAEEANRRFDAELKKRESLAKQEAAALERLRQKYDQGHVAMEIYSRELNDLGTALKRGIITKAQYTKELERLNTATKMGTVVSSEFGGVAGQMGRRLSRSGVMVQQAGYQIGDFIVQVQSGQNPMVAFGQQATQMAGTLTMLGGRMVAIGTGLGIAIPLVTAFGAAWMRAKGESDEASKSLKSLDDRVKSLRSSLADFQFDQKSSILGLEPDEFALNLALERSKQKLEEVKREFSGFETGKISLRSTLTALVPFADQFGIGPIDQIKEAEAEVTRLLLDIADLESKIAEKRRKKDEEFESNRRSSQEDFLSGLMQESNFWSAMYGKNQDQIDDLNEKRDLHNKLLELGLKPSDKLYLDALKYAEQIKSSKEATEGLAKAVEDASSSFETLLGQSSNIDVEIAKVVAQIDAVKKGSDVATAAYIANERAQISATAAATKALALKTNNLVLLAETSIAYAEAMAKLDNLESLKLEFSKIKPSSGGSSEKQDPLAKLKAQLKLERDLVGVSEERARIINALGMDFVKDNPKIVEGLEAQILKTKELTELEEKRQGIIDTVESSMEDNFMAMVEGTKSVEDAFKDMARSIIKELYDVLVVQQMVNSISGSIFGGSGSSAGSLFSLFGSSGAGRLKLFDGGGYTGSGPRSGGLDGRGGFLAMMHPRETVVDHTKAGSAVGGEGVTVVQNFNFQANGDDSVKKIIAQAAPSIANMAKQSVMDARRRGGAMKNTFG
jgi:DNA repair exonuclease SbcCD ATPase subunit